MDRDWLVYILRCNDGTFYTGATNDIEKRLKAHNSGKNGAKYTKTRRPVELAVMSKLMTKSESLKLEYKIKQMKKLDKIKFLSSLKV